MKKTAQFFKALSDETRLRILALLTDGERCVCELMATLDLPQSTVSRHLAYLRNNALVEGRRDGVWMYYRLAQDMPPFVAELIPLLQAHLASLPQGEMDQQGLAAFLARGDSARCG